MKRNLIIATLAFIALSATAQNRQPQVIDKVAAVVGQNIILQSEIENQYLQYRLNGMTESPQAMRCQILEDLLLQKLMLNQAEMDSITVTDEQVEAEMNQRIRYFVSRMGSQEKLEEYFNKTISEIKDEVRRSVKDNQLQQRVQAGIMEGIEVTPKEVQAFYRSIPLDSIPMVDEEFEVAQIVKRPPVSPRWRCCIPKTRARRVREANWALPARACMPLNLRTSLSTCVMEKSPMWWRQSSASISFS